MITTRQDVSGQVARQGYALLASDAIDMDAASAAAWRDLQADWQDLVLDGHMRDGATYRKRRFGLFYLGPGGGELLPYARATYFQGGEINGYAGGIARDFAPLSPETLANPCLEALIRFDFEQFPVHASHAACAWEVDVHLVRIESGDQGGAQPTPEGVHRDGVEFVSVHLAGLDNLVGGKASVYDEERSLLCQTSLERPLDSYYLWDRRVLHGVSPIFQRAPGRPAVRDVLLIGFEPKPGLARPTPGATVACRQTVS